MKSLIYEGFFSNLPRGKIANFPYLLSVLGSGMCSSQGLSQSKFPGDTLLHVSLISFQFSPPPPFMPISNLWQVLYCAFSYKQYCTQLGRSFLANSHLPYITEIILTMSQKRNATLRDSVTRQADTEHFQGDDGEERVAHHNLSCNTSSCLSSAFLWMPCSRYHSLWGRWTRRERNIYIYI